MEEINQVKALRELNNFTQAWVAKKLGISQSYYSKLENFPNKFSPQLKKKLESIFQITDIHPLFKSDTQLIETLLKSGDEFRDMKSKLHSIEIRLGKIEEIISKKY